MFAAAATNTLGRLIKNDRLIDAAEAIADRLSVPVALAPASDHAI